jgi:hypothetical protein
MKNRISKKRNTLRRKSIKSNKKGKYGGSIDALDLANEDQDKKWYQGSGLTKKEYNTLKEIYDDITSKEDDEIQRSISLLAMVTMKNFGEEKKLTVNAIDDLLNQKSELYKKLEEKIIENIKMTIEIFNMDSVSKLGKAMVNSRNKGGLPVTTSIEIGGSAHAALMKKTKPATLANEMVPEELEPVNSNPMDVFETEANPVIEDPKYEWDVSRAASTAFNSFRSSLPTWQVPKMAKNIGIAAAVAAILYCIWLASQSMVGSQIPNDVQGQLDLGNNLLPKMQNMDEKAINVWNQVTDNYDFVAKNAAWIPAAAGASRNAPLWNSFSFWTGSGSYQDMVSQKDAVFPGDTKKMRVNTETVMTSRSGSGDIIDSVENMVDGDIAENRHRLKKDELKEQSTTALTEATREAKGLNVPTRSFKNFDEIAQQNIFNEVKGNIDKTEINMHHSFDSMAQHLSKYVSQKYSTKSSGYEKYDDLSLHLNQLSINTLLNRFTERFRDGVTSLRQTNLGNRLSNEEVKDKFSVLELSEKLKADGAGFSSYVNPETEGYVQPLGSNFDSFTKEWLVMINKWKGEWKDNFFNRENRPANELELGEFEKFLNCLKLSGTSGKVYQKFDDVSAKIGILAKTFNFIPAFKNLHNTLRAAADNFK